MQSENSGMGVGCRTDSQLCIQPQGSARRRGCFSHNQLCTMSASCFMCYPRLILFLCLCGILGSRWGNSSPCQRKEWVIQFSPEERGLMLLLEASMTSGFIINLGMDRPLGKHFLPGGTKCSSVTLLQGCSALILSQWRWHFNHFINFTHLCTLYNWCIYVPQLTWFSMDNVRQS